MAVQLPVEGLGTAIGVLLWTLLCLSCTGLMLWLAWTHHEKTSYIAFLGYFAGLATCASIAQQLHTIVRWRDIKTHQYEHSVAHAGSPELAIAGESTGLDLGLFYIQLYSYNVQALLSFFWATSLAQSICQTTRFRIGEPRATLTTKLISVILPAIVLSLLAIPAVRDSDIAFFILANILMAVGMGGGMIMLAIITCKYFHARFNVHSWNARYYTSSHGTQLTDGEALPQLRPVETQFFDRWLVIRFSIGFLAMSAFQVVIILFSVRAARTSKEASTLTGPDLSIEKLRVDFLLFMPAPTAGLFYFLVFGTTRVLRAYMWDKLVPRCIKRRFKKKEETAHELVNRRGAGGGGRGSGKTLSHQTDTLSPSSVGDSAEISGMGDEADSDPETGTRGQRAPWPEPPDPVRTRWS